MKSTIQLILVFLFMGFLQLEAQVEVTNYGDIPVDRIAANGWAHFEWDGSGTWETIDVTQEGIIPGTSEDIAPLVTAIINGGSGKRILKFPAGTFQIKSGMNISKSDIQIVGEGSSTRFMLQGGANPGSIFGNGGRSGDYRLAADAARGDNTATFTSASAFNVGDYFIIYQAGDVTRPGASGDETQIFKIIGKSGNTLTLDMKFGIPFYKTYSRIEKISYKKNLRFHNFYMEMATEPTDGKSTNLSLNTVQNVEISNVESNKCLTGHITVYRGREVILHHNNVYGNYGHDTQGGYQYGYTFNFSTNCHMIHNRTADLRHHYVTQFGTDHCVIAYNRADPPYNHYADYGQHNSKGCHNNLWEGNYGSEIYDDANPLKSWGTRYTMWYRNHATSKVGSENEYVEYMNIIGNELTGGADAIKKGAPGKYTFAGANIVNINGEGGDGTMVWGDLNSVAELPASLFLNDQPSYVSRWPLFGPPVKTLPQSELAIYLIKPDTNYIQLEPEYTLTIEAQVSDEELLDSLSLYLNGNIVSAIKNTPFIWHLTSVAQTNDNNVLNMGLNTLKLFAIDSLGAASTLDFTVEVKESPAPFLGEPINVPGIIEAENYDKGGEGVAYHDSDASNQGGVYRNDGVDIEMGGSGYVIGNTIKGEWLEYTIDVIESDDYDLHILYSSGRPGGGARITISFPRENINIVTNIVLPETGGWSEYNDFSFGLVRLEKGIHVLRIAVADAGFNLDRIEVKKEMNVGTERLFAKSLKVHPNPSFSGQFSLSDSEKWEVFTMNGIKIIEGEGKSINLSQHSEGVYLLKTQSRIFKLMIKRE